MLNLLIQHSEFIIQHYAVNIPPGGISMPKSKRKAKKPSPKRRLLPKKAEKDQAFAELLVEFADVTNWRQRAFLAGFVLGKGLRGAQRLSGIHWKSHYRWLDNDPLYAARFEL